MFGCSGLNRLRETEKIWIASNLNKLPFVKWDRLSYLIPPRIEKDRSRGLWLVVFGWIDRKDAYKDFIVVDFEVVNKTPRVGVIQCSSKEYSEVAIKLLLGVEETIKHNSCFRVEDIGGVENCVKLK